MQKEMNRHIQMEDLSLPSLLQKCENWIVGEEKESGRSFSVNDIIIYREESTFWIARIWYTIYDY